MERSDRAEAVETSPSSVIGSDITITGSIEATVDLLIEGKVHGDVRCQTLLLGESSSIKGNIYAERVRVSGAVDGAVETCDLAIEGTGSVTGDVSYARLKVATGGAVDGIMKHRPEVAARIGSRSDPSPTLHVPDITKPGRLSLRPRLPGRADMNQRDPIGKRPGQPH